MRDFEWQGLRTNGPEGEERGPLGTVTPLLAKLFEDLQLLVRQELSLARAELREEGGRAQRLIGWLMVSGILGVIAAALLVIASVLALQALLVGAPLWACFAGVGALAGIAAITIHLVTSMRGEGLTLLPRRTMKTLKEHLQWLRRP